MQRPSASRYIKKNSLASRFVRHPFHSTRLAIRRKISPYISARKRRLVKESLVIIFSAILICGGLAVYWFSTLPLPDLSAFDQRKVDESTKIYDRTGKILLYDVNQDIKRTVVPFNSISPYIKDATLAIEDEGFYQNNGIEPKSIIRAFFTDVFTLHLSEGGSTITQQVIKNAFLTDNKTLTRKIEEWVLAIKLDRDMDKDSIFGVYLNENPYGGNIYGVEEASEEYFGVSSSDVTLAQAAYLAAIPQSPTYYSPFGPNKAALDTRKNLVLQKMLDDKYITQAQYTEATGEKVTFGQQEDHSIKAPWFVFYIINYLNKKYGSDMVQNGGLKVITTLNYSLQSQAEQIVQKTALSNEKTINAKNAALVAIDPQTGQILTMVGSRNFFDTEIDGQYNVALALRQPGSAFKPFVYSEAFIKGYTPDTVVFDLPIEFSAECTPDQKLKDPNDTNPADACYHPVNYDGKFRGPINLRDAISQSLNVPSIQVEYLAGIGDSINLAKSMGITSLGDPDQYGLTLVLGGGQVSLLDMTSAYSVFANSGIRNPDTGILEVDDKNGNVLEQFTPNPAQVLDKQIALTMNNVLSDNVARAPEFGSDSPLYFPDYDVADKTGTTNNFRDVWVMGYSPNMTVGAWAGNNDDTPMNEEIARYALAPMWNQFMQIALKTVPKENFEAPAPVDESQMKPVMQGIWQGGQSYWINKDTGELATQYTPASYKKEMVVPLIHSILYWVDKNNPLGPAPTDPSSDPQFANWEYAVRKWATENGYKDADPSSIIPTKTDSEHLPTLFPNVQFTNPLPQEQYDQNGQINITLNYTGHYPITKADFYLNDMYLGSANHTPFNFSFIPNNNGSLGPTNKLSVIITDAVGNTGSSTEDFMIDQ